MAVDPRIYRRLPKFTYRGLTIIMSNPSRFDKKELLEGVAGHYFRESCLSPEINIYQCDLRLIDDKSPLLPETKVILLLGERAHALYTNAGTSLDENRGSPILVGNIPCISTFAPVDAIDLKNYEAQHNREALEGYTEESEDSPDEEANAGDYFAAKGKSKTARSNYRFWIRQDTKKAIRILDNGGKMPDISDGITPKYHIYPASQIVINKLLTTKHQDLFIDIETDIETLDMRCFAFCFGSDPGNVYVVPTLDIYYKPAYSELPQILGALTIALRDNCAVAHNGAHFDFTVFAYKYRLPIGRRVFDTLIANHRIYPTVEKSLGHCMSLWTYEPFHKNEGDHTYRTQQQADRLYLYCGKDVWGMYLVKKMQDKFAEKDAGLQASIRQAMRAINPYVATTLMGIHFNEEKRQAWIKMNDRLMMQYIRLMRILMGPGVPDLISNQKCTHYFNDLLGYPVVARTKANKSSLKEDALYKLQLKLKAENLYNPVIDFLVRYRQVKKQTGTLNFKIYRKSQAMLQQENLGLL